MIERDDTPAETMCDGNGECYRLDKELALALAERDEWHRRHNIMLRTAGQCLRLRGEAEAELSQVLAERDEALRALLRLYQQTPEADNEDRTAGQLESAIEAQLAANDEAVEHFKARAEAAESSLRRCMEEKDGRED
jgi:hypothetical protein